MAIQAKFALPGGDFSVIDNGAAPVVITANGSPQTSNGQTGINRDGTTLGFDTISPGTQSQGTNPFGDTGSTTLDTVNDTIFADPSISTVKGNPVSNTPPTFATVSTILNTVSGQRLLWKNPAIIF